MLARRAWAAAMLGIGVSPALLTSDLGRPLRFLNMLRMFKVTSPMSVGSWILTASGATTALAAASVWTGRFPRAGKAARPAAAAFGLPLCTYTAALIANTAVPVWHESASMAAVRVRGGRRAQRRSRQCNRHVAGARQAGAQARACERRARGRAQGARWNAGSASTASPTGKEPRRSFGRLGQLCISTRRKLAGSPRRQIAGGGDRGRGAALGGSAQRSLERVQGGLPIGGESQVRRPASTRGIERGERPGAARQESYARDPERALGSPATAPLELSAS